MKRNRQILCFLTLAVLVTACMNVAIAQAAPTRVGNGDDGGDLENGTPVKSGILVETRDEAVALLKKLNVSGIEGLSKVTAEVEKSQLLLVGQNVDLSKTSAAPEEIEAARDEAKSIGAVNDNGLPVYARTFPEPHAATRFFPAAMMLDRKQLVALHIHEALHRALPAEIRTNEKAVSRITMAVASPDSSFDRVKEVTSLELEAARASKVAAQSSNSGGQIRAQVDESEFAAPIIRQPNIFEYSYRSYNMPDPDKSLAPVRSMHSLRSFLYPFGRSKVVGLGLEFTYIGLQEKSYLGPMGISGRVKLATWRGFLIDTFAALHMNTVAAGEFKNSPIGRDTGTLGLSMAREEKNYRVANKVYFTTGSEAKQKLGAIEYKHTFGSITAAGISAAAKIPMNATSNFEIGGNGEVLLANPYSVEGGSFRYTSDRIRVVTVGPELAMNIDNLRIAAIGRFVIDSTEGVQLDQLGDLLGQGVGQGSVGGTATWTF